MMDGRGWGWRRPRVRRRRGKVECQILEGSRHADEARNFENEVSSCEKQVQKVLEDTAVGTMCLSRTKLATRDWNGRNTSAEISPSRIRLTYQV